MIASILIIKTNKTKIEIKIKQIVPKKSIILKYSEVILIIIFNEYEITRL